MLRPRNLIRPAARYPADPRAVFILALSVFGGLGAALADQGPDTLEALIPKWGVVTWGITLVLGSALALIGLWLDSDNGIITEQIGSVMVGSACVFYSTIAAIYIGVGSIQIVGIVMAWGLACFLRWIQLQLLIQQHVRDRLHGQIQEAIANRNVED